MTMKSMTSMWALLGAYTHNQLGKERAVNALNEWGGFSRVLNLPVFTAWTDHITFDKADKTTKALVLDSSWSNKVGVNNQERWLKFAETDCLGRSAFFVIHAKDVFADPRKVDYIEDERVFVGAILREDTKTYIVGKPRAL